MANIITNLKEYRKARKISQQELAQLVGVRRETIVHLENNRYNPSLEMALKIAEIFDCHVEELFQLKKEAEND
ncbi:TPA: helix-turn-helix transcriptional regulator [Streptococcus suis]|uniref:Helix-turn-helix transcriptional regulator n=1 Tax=Streptococcus oriscaviae TaxID=2781599 RepID=A0ABX7YKD6_9STRE|nr:MULTISPECIES: helix-turn-helix transcriptional regulator [Streptococcus]QUE54281.1 helix-turn-helix transcriptional regulator [Streptococcus oriscaviae]HEM3213213.1 helix-turn-helix transcriptional regulator [Streptococcus suis 12814]HEM4253730.1 helix-turn-helix transcriptional regulator [Streptococcus suis]HEM5198217.1 helix-turn-helix transcriptional regulator [Streptococcus suis]HEM5312025.1 helix-turn-helix transcriptional regulator [Streptococcus suis]